tara:strand:- start:25092 stop:25436 length:345 start_codon:yes stop_codon:yes gene_type:complete
MKKIITLLLIITIQITFIQKVIASVALVESDVQSMMVHCEMNDMVMNSDSCLSEMGTMNNCQVGCGMMSVVSVAHFIDINYSFFFVSTDIGYTPFNPAIINSLPKNHFRPPLYS